MINLKVLNKALTDPNITNAEFRLLYLIANNISMGKTGSKEIYNGFLMDKLHLSERQIQRLTKSLEDKHYIIKRGIGKSVKRNGNLYSLPSECETIPSEIDHNTHGDMADDKNDTPYIEEKENKNILVNTSIRSEEWKPNLRVCEEIDDIPFGIDEAMVTVSEDDGKRIEDKNNNETDMSYTCYTEEDIRAYSLQVSEEWKQIEEVHCQNGEYQKIAVWVGKILRRGYDLLRSFEKSKTREGASAYASEISELIDKMNKAVEADKLTQGQYGAFNKFVNSYNRAVGNKEAYFKRGEQMKSKQPQRMEKGNYTLILPSGEDIGKTAPIPILKADSNSEIITAEELMAAFENFEEDKDANQYIYYSLNETTLKTESMTDKEREYFRKEEGYLTDEGVLNRYIKAYKWLRNPMDADRLFETYQERASQIANGNYAIFEKYINLWDKHCEQVA